MGTARAKLRLVEREPDIYAAWRAEIAERDWSAVHIEGDKREPLPFLTRMWRGWRG